MSKSKKMGRPKSDDPKEMKLIIRFTKEDMNQIEKYAKKNNLTKTEVVRLAVQKLI